MATNPDIRSDLHRIAESIAARSEKLTLRDDDSAIPEPVDTFRGALLARYHEGYSEGLHDMAEAVVGYLNSRRTPPAGRYPTPAGSVRPPEFGRDTD